ncbi:MAG TPA: terminase gpA endonuclease subunit, partial [Aquirhabdus sp.]
MKPPQKISTAKWSSENLSLNQKASAKSGKYDPHLTPYIIGILDAMDDPKIRKIVCCKSAQVSWTTALMAYLTKRIDVDPCPMIILFSKEGAAKSFESEKFLPMVESSQRLQEILPAIKKSRDKENRWWYKGFAGGFLKLVGSNAMDSVKSTPAPLVAVEEPDDCSQNLDGQGDSITNLEERCKTFENSKVIFGGTPTIEGVSRIEAAYKQSDRRMFYVPCHLCNEAHVLMWENVKWDVVDGLNHEVYGNDLPESAYYECPHCRGRWSDNDKNRNIKRAEVDGFGWKAHAPFDGIAGFYVNEVYSPFAGSKFASLARKYLAARYALSHGSDTKMRSFRNNTEGKSYSYSSDAPTVDSMMKMAEDYPEFSVPLGGCILTVGIDVQHDRFAICVRAWGAGEESWLVYWGEIFGQTTAYGHGAWIDLEQFLQRDFDGLKIQAG